jgi:hypothetical protein
MPVQDTLGASCLSGDRPAGQPDTDNRRVLAVRFRQAQEGAASEPEASEFRGTANGRQRSRWLERHGSIEWLLEGRADSPQGRIHDDSGVPGESVHHRNGVRDDKRPENLELWTRPQPTGICVSDAVAWAHQILDRYEGHCGTSNNAHGLP